jgi:hypothetical protein
MPRRSLLNEDDPIRRVDRHSSTEEQSSGVMATEDPHLIRAWAKRHSAEPATGEATSSGPAALDVHDGGAGIRFNFPAAARFRPVTWDEWFQHFSRHELMFVYEADEPGHPPSARYRLVPKNKLQGK